MVLTDRSTNSGIFQLSPLSPSKPFFGQNIDGKVKSIYESHKFKEIKKKEIRLNQLKLEDHSKKNTMGFGGLSPEILNRGKNGIGRNIGLVDNTKRKAVEYLMVKDTW